VHRENVGRTLRRVARECKFEKLPEINLESFERWLRTQQTNNMGARTRNYYRNTWLAFCNWCVHTYRLSANPLVRVTKADEQTDRRRQRRAMAEAELIQLLEVARWRPLAEYGRRSIAKDETERNGKRSNWTFVPLTLDELPAAMERARQSLSKRPDFIAKLERLGRERSLIYKTLVLTGLRKGELASITVGQLNLDAPQPFAELHAADEKNRQGSQIAIRADLAADLRQWLAEKHAGLQIALRGNGKTISMQQVTKLPAGTSLFTIPSQLVRILDRDLQAAGIAKADERGRTLDVHALRHSFGTLLSRGGVSPRTAQSAMRHSSIDLTMNVYTDPKLLDVHGALDSLPSLPISSSPFKAPETIKATGTNDLGQNQFAPAFAPTTGNQIQTLTTHGKHDALSSVGKRDKKMSVTCLPDTTKNPLPHADNGSLKERATRFELATSSLGS
jgi:integrase